MISAFRPSSRVLILAGLLLAAAVASAQPLHLEAAVERYGSQEISFSLPGDFANPYDPDDVRVEALIRAPSGDRGVVPGFYWEGHDPFQNTPIDERGWKVRYTPEEVGEHIVRITVSRRGGEAEVFALATFQCIPSNRPGFVTVKNGRVELTTGRPLSLVGVNRPWGDARHFEDYLAAMDEAAEAGVRVLRVWLAPWWLPVEAEHGRYDQGACARLDTLLGHAGDLGLKVVLCIEQHGNFQPEGGEIGLWPKHPYNSANSGPCRNVGEFFTSPEARRLFRNRLRYLVARFGHSTALMAWELFNEVEWVPYRWGEYERHRQRVLTWHVEMARTLRTLDPFGHLVLTSSDPFLQQALAELQAIDLVQLHIYSERQLAKEIAGQLATWREAFELPIIVAEYGLKKRQEDSCEWLTDGLYAAWLSGAAGAWPWIQDEPEHGPCYARITAAKRFPWSNGHAGRALDVIEATIANDDAGSGPPLFAARADESVLCYVAGAPDEAGGRQEGRQIAVRLQPVEAGEYVLNEWNPAMGRIIRSREIVVSGGEAEVAIPLRDGGCLIELIRKGRPDGRQGDT